jgi:hypothetical protein
MPRAAPAGAALEARRWMAATIARPGRAVDPRVQIK